MITFRDERVEEMEKASMANEDTSSSHESSPEDQAEDAADDDTLAPNADNDDEYAQQPFTSPAGKH